MSTIYKLFSNIYEIFKILILIKYKKNIWKFNKKNPSNSFRKGAKDRNKCFNQRRYKDDS